MNSSSLVPRCPTVPGRRGIPCSLAAGYYSVVATTSSYLPVGSLEPEGHDGTSYFNEQAIVSYRVSIVFGFGTGNQMTYGAHRVRLPEVRHVETILPYYVVTMRNLLPFCTVNGQAFDTRHLPFPSFRLQSVYSPDGASME